MIHPVQRRHARSRNTMLEGLSMEGMPARFGAIAISMFLLVGILLLLTRETISADELVAQQITLGADAYRPSGAGEKTTILLPTTRDGKLLSLQDFGFRAAEHANILGEMKKGDALTVYLDSTANASFLDRSKSVRVPVRFIRKNDNWLLSPEAYNKSRNTNSQAGWWMILLSLAFVPYFFIRNPRLHPGWLLAAAIIIGGIILVL